MENGAFSEEKSKDISDKYVAVRLTGGNDITPEVKEFMGRYAVRGYPTLYVMNAAGHVVVSKVGRTVDAMLEALAEGDKAEIEFAAAAKKDDPEGRKAYREMLKGRMAWGDLAALQAVDLKASPSADAYAELAATYGSSGRPADERATLEKALELFKDAKQRPAWRMRLATMDHDPAKASSKAEYDKIVEEFRTAVESLLAKFVEEKDAPGQAQAHVSLGLVMQRLNKQDDAEKHFDAALQNDAKGTSAPTALMGKANCAFARQDWAGCKTQLEKIIAEFPDSAEGKLAPRGIENCNKRIEAAKK